MRLPVAHSTPQRGAVQVGHAHVADDGIKARFGQQLQRHGAGLGRGHVDAGAFQHVAHEVGDLGFVVDHQHPRMQIPTGRVQRRGLAGWAGFATDGQAEAKRGTTGAFFKDQFAAMFTHDGT